jgi:hypothetical protein
VKIKTEEDAHAAEVLLDTVRRMRGAQKHYFSVRGYSELQQAKALEKEVDEQLDYWEVRELMEKQPELFPAQ